MKTKWLEDIQQSSADIKCFIHCGVTNYMGSGKEMN